ESCCRAPGRRMRSSRPGRASAGSRARTAPLGGSQRTLARGFTGESAHAVGEGLTPGHGPAAGRHLVERKLDLGGEVLSDPHAQAVALALAGALRVEGALRAEILPLGVGGREVFEPPRDLVIVTAAEHARILAFVEATRQALLAAFLVHERRLPALLAEVAETPARRRGPRFGFGFFLAAEPYVLTQGSRERVGQRQDLGGPEPGGLT